MNDEISFAEFDRITEQADRQQAVIDNRVNYLIASDPDLIEEIIGENADVIWSIIKSGKDVECRLNETIRHYVEIFVENGE